VLEAAAVGIPDPNYGQDILAAVVLKPGAVCDEATLRSFCLARTRPLQDAQGLPLRGRAAKGPSGKVQRLSLVAPGAP